MLLGCIGDDFTGSSDLANTLAKAGMRTVQYTGVPSGPAETSVQAGVVALKSRSIAAADAVQQSLEALAWLQAQGCEQIFFKYCSTFDSTPEGNIGPVADALADALNADNVIVCPAFPGTGRSIYQGYLFVNDRLLNESGMENHPLTPMKDADLRRLMTAQSEHSVGLVSMQHVFQGAAAIAQQMKAETDKGHRMLVVDALQDNDLFEIGKAAKGLPLITGGSGVAMGLPKNFGCEPQMVAWEAQQGKAGILSGSCSQATRNQVAYHLERHPGLQVDVQHILDGKQTPQQAADWLLGCEGLGLVYSSAEPAEVQRTQAEVGTTKAAQTLERFFGETAALAVAGGLTRLLTAGGETAGAVVERLQIEQLTIGPEIDPGVPAVRANDHLVLALKSGNFGTVDYFEKAAGVLGS